jgi:hypothetical protein
MVKRALFTAATVLVMAALVTITPASAEVITNQDLPVNFTLFNPCN